MKLLLIETLLFAFVWSVPISERGAFPLERHHSKTRNLEKDESLILDARLIGGNRAKIGQFPCGALIDRKWVLTGGRCVYGAFTLRLFLGTISLFSGGITLEASHSVVHPDYNPLTFENDIGLIRIDDTFELNDNIQIISIATSELSNEASVTVSGWGAPGDWGSIQSELNFINLKTISNNECKISWGAEVPETTVCAVGNGTNGICNGDSGDPLVMKKIDGTSVHVGIASWSSASGCLTFQPSGYTRTASYKYWIQTTIAKET